MKIVGCMPVRNEACILGLSAGVALQWCDELVILLHACTDSSHEIAWEVYRENEGRIHVCDWKDSTWAEMPQRQFLLEQSRMNGATHVAIVDSDECLTANLLPSIRGMVGGLQRGTILQLPLYNLRGSIDRYHANGLWGNRIVSVAFMDDPRLGWTGDKFHAREPVGMPTRGLLRVAQGEGGVIHFWGASERRLLAKHALYKVTERLRWPDKPVAEIDRLYSAWRDGLPLPGQVPVSQWQYKPVPSSWWAPPHINLPPKLDLEGDVWQEGEVRRLIAEHGREKFSGLDLFGVGE